MNNNKLFKQAGQPQQQPQLNTPQLNSPWQHVQSTFLDDFRKSVRENSLGNSKRRPF